jgi:oleate hydratase
MTEGSAVGSNDHAPLLLNKKSGGAWSLWESIARDRIDCGNPANFTDHVDESKWVSFTTTLTDPTLFNFIRNLSGSVAGEGGAMTFADSNWLFTLGVPHQPHFLEQPEGVQVFWGYGLSVDKPGNFVKKPMSACSGKELMMEILGHLGMVDGVDEVLSASTCVPCMMPFITSQFLRRSPGDRPSVIPERSKNVAFMGQYCEIPHDVVFTVEYSIRSAQLAVYGLLGLELHPPPMYRGDHNLRVLLEAYSVLHATAVA